MATYYDILGVEKDASCEIIRKAYRSKAKALHPDINSTPGAKSSFQLLNEAYQVLKDDRRRKLYDMRLQYRVTGPRIYQRNGYSTYSRKRYSVHDMGEDEEVSGKFERFFDFFLYLFMLGAGIFALLFGISRLWAEPIYGVNPVIGIVFGALLTFLLIWGWHYRKKTHR